MTQVTSRELETLLQLACFHALTAAQVEAFLFAGSTLRPASRARVTRRILAGLVGARYLEASRRVFAAGSGPARRVYGLTASGEAVLRRTDRRAGPPPARRGSLFVEHALMTADVALAFRRAARAKPGHAILSWESDWDLVAAIPGSPLVPDARVVFGIGDITLDAFLEVDRATERPAAFGRKIAAYLEWHWTGRWREQMRIWPVVLVVTPTAVRATSLRRTTETCCGAGEARGPRSDSRRSRTSRTPDRSRRSGRSLGASGCTRSSTATPSNSPPRSSSRPLGRRPAR